MVRSYTAKYSKIDSGYIGQLVEWPEVVTEGKISKSAAICLGMPYVR